MNRIISVFLLIVMGLMLCACSASEGVPDARVIRDFKLTDTEQEYDIIHNYNSEIRIDDVQLVIYNRGKYGVKKTIHERAYQYDKSSDTWTDISKQGTGLLSFLGKIQYEYDEDALIKGSPWTGTYDSYLYESSYSITVLEINNENKTMVIEYRIDYSSKWYEDTEGTCEVKLTGNLFKITSELGNKTNTFFFKIDIENGIAMTKQ